MIQDEHASTTRVRITSNHTIGWRRSRYNTRCSSDKNTTTLAATQNNRTRTRLSPQYNTGLNSIDPCNLACAVAHITCHGCTTRATDASCLWDEHIEEVAGRG